jgi:CubicO group peptidase (beta-lactamase class C family)
MRRASALLFATTLTFPAVWGCAEPPSEDPSAGAPGAAAAPEAAVDEAREQMLQRARELELDTEYVPPPGDPLAHHTAGFAKILCSNVFIAGLDPDFVAENVGYFSSPYEHRAQVVDTVVDFDREAVHLTLPDGVTRTAKRYGSQGCVALPIGEDSVRFAPVTVEPDLPDPGTTPWPMGDLLPDEPLPAELDADRVAAAVEAAFDPPDGMTAAFVVTHRGRIIGERYGEGIDLNTALESWSMGKSLAGTLMGVLIQQGEYELWQPAPVPEWQEPGDPRQEIRIGDIMRMSSGLRFRAPQDPDFDPEAGFPDHLYVYTGTANSFEWAATRPLQWPPNTVGRYRNSDPVLANYLIRLAVEGRGENYWEFPQRNLFDRLGIRNAFPEVDPYGNFLLQGYEMVSARDWARLGNLYLQDGVWDGERILPEGYAEYASTLAPAWEADGRRVYGGAFFWVNRDGSFPVPEDAYRMAGAGGQTALIIPSHDLVVVRLGHYRGASEGGQALRRALELLMEAVPPS